MQLQESVNHGLTKNTTAIQHGRRDANIVSLFLSGMTLQEVGDTVGLTRERVRQILRDRGINRYQGGMSLRAVVRRKEKETLRRANEKQREKEHLADLEQWSVRVLGVPLAEAFLLNGEPFTIKRVHCANQNQNIYQKYLGVKRQRQIKKPNERYLTLREWYEIWTASGHWENGPNPGWVLVRNDANKPWSVENAQIVRQGSWMKGKRWRRRT
ncbi:MAG: sigma factor-like helix-turn-helix DNA-binding protein [Acidithiobacillus sp.]